MSALARILLPLIALLVVACSKPAAKGEAPRIVSVGSAVTEIVFALGAGPEVVAVDTSSLWPEAETKALPKIGYQRTLSAEGVLSTKPTVLLIPEEAGPPNVIEQIASAGVRVVRVVGAPSAEGIRAKIATIAEAVGRVDAGRTLADQVDRAIADARAEVAKASSKPKAILVFARGAGTVMVAGRATAGDAILELAGAANAASGFEGFKPISAESVVEAAPEVIVVPAHGLASVGGVDGLLALPGLALTPAGKARRVVSLDDLLLLGFGPRTGEAIRALHAALRSGA